jgi:hypothetical protein
MGYGQAVLTGDDSSSVKDKAAESVDAGKQAVEDVAQTATDKLTDVAHETKKQARDLLGEAKSQLTQHAGTQHRTLVDNLRALADELASMAGRTEDGGVATDLVSQAGERAHGAANWLERREPGDLLGEVRTFAQQRPGTFLLGAAVAGVLAGRLTRGVAAVHSDDSEETSRSTPRHEAGQATSSYPARPAPSTYPGGPVTSEPNGYSYPGTGGVTP